MALSLTAEQKELLKIFKIEEEYVIPAYQRPYSWEYDHCFQLYNDLVEAFESKEDYFIGNIIISKSDTNKGVLQVIDGQQRLTTLLLLIKVLSIFNPKLVVLKEILEKTDWTGKNSGQRIKSEIFEANDGKDLENVLKYTKDDFEDKFKECQDKKGKFVEKKCNNRFEKNIMYFYDCISFYKTKHSNIEAFIKYILIQVYLLPIELTGKTIEEANEKALIIFETINNRGMNLEDADIFKAKLFHKSDKVGEKKIFIEQWSEFKDRCDDLNLDIDDVFRYYSHIIRGKEGITSSEINLRRFFTIEKYSPFKLKKYKEILNDLFRIVEVLEYINQEKKKTNQLSKWIQLIEIYTNRYPKIALVVYLYNNQNRENFDYSILESIVRYSYYYGSTTKIKFGIYTIIKQISLQQSVNPYYREEIDIDYFDYLGSLKFGYALLAFYSNREKSLEKYSVDKLVNLKDKKSLVSLNEKNIEDNINILGNFIVLDIPKKNKSFDKRVEYYKNSSLPEVKKIATLLSNDITLSDLENRDIQMKEKLVKFFKGTK